MVSPQKVGDKDTDLEKRVIPSFEPKPRSFPDAVGSKMAIVEDGFTVAVHLWFDTEDRQSPANC